MSVVPKALWGVIAALLLLSCALALRTQLARRGARRLERQRRELLGEVGLLQRALLPDLPARMPGIEVSVAYRPADGLAAGGDFYDVFPLDSTRTALIVGDVMGHGRESLAVTALMRYSLRAYLSAGLEPRLVLRVAGRALKRGPGGKLTTVAVAIFDAEDGTLTYACAGHHPPILLGAGAHRPVTICSAPPLGGIIETGQRQTRVELAAGSTVCLFTDGLVEARVEGDLLGRQRVTELVKSLSTDEDADVLLERVAARADHTPDDMAACIIRVAARTETTDERVEDLEVGPGELNPERLEPFLRACAVPSRELQGVLAQARACVSDHGAALLRVVITGGRGALEVVPRSPGPVVIPATGDARVSIATRGR